MTRGKPLRLVLSLAVPLILTNIGQQLYLIADASIVGRGVGVSALAAVGSADWSYCMVLWTVIGTAQAFGVFVSRHFGSGDLERMNRTVAMSVILCAAVSIILTFTGLLVTRPLLALLGTPGDIAADAAVYMETMISGIIAVAAYNMAAAVLRAFGNGRDPLAAMIISAVVNIGLDLLFVLVFGLGVFGAALASVTAQFVSFLYCLVRIRKIGIVKIRKDMWKPDLRMCAGMLRFSVPVSSQFILIALSGMFLQSTLNGHGSVFVAGFTATNKLYGLLECSAISVGETFATYFSQNYGAGNYGRIRRGVSLGLAISAVLALIVMAVFISGGRLFLKAFIDAEEAGADEAMSVAYYYLLVMSLCLLILYPIHIYRNALLSLGNSFWPMMSGVSECAARVFMATGAVVLFGQDAVFYAEPAAWVGALLLSVLPYYHYRRKLLSGGDGTDKFMRSGRSDGEKAVPPSGHKSGAEAPERGIENETDT